MIFLESVWGCLRDCSTKCGGWGNRPEFMPSGVLAALIAECKEAGLTGIQLYGRGDVLGYPFHELGDLTGCEIAVTNISYHMTDELRGRGCTVFARIDDAADVEMAPVCDGYFTVQVPLPSFFDVLVAALGLRPFAIKSLDGHGENPFVGYDLRAANFPAPYHQPDRIDHYAVPSTRCRIPLVTHFGGETYYQSCVSGAVEYRAFATIVDLMKDGGCQECGRFPKQKRIYHYE